MFQPSPAPNPAEVLPVEAARKIMENGVLLGIATLAIIAGLVAMWAFVLWWKKKIELSGKPPEPAPTPDRCANCDFMQEFRSIPELSQHRVFGLIRYGVAFKIPSLPIMEAGRKLVFTDLLTVKLRAIESALTEWLKVHHDDIDDLSPDALQGSMMSMIVDIIEDYESELRRMGMPFVVLDVFRQWHGSRVEYLREECTLICESEWINTNVERIGMCFSMIEHVIRTTLLDAEMTMNNLNGQLTGKVYKGVTIGECPPRKRSGNSGMFETLK